jgi:hypothetical protein
VRIVGAYDLTRDEAAPISRQSSLAESSFCLLHRTSARSRAGKIPTHVAVEYSSSVIRLINDFLNDGIT